MMDPSKTITGGATEPCDNCGRKPAVRAFLEGRAANWFLCAECDAKVATHYQCMGCGGLFETLMYAVEHMTAITDELRSTAAERHKHPKRKGTVIRFPSPNSKIGPQMVAEGDWR